MKKKLFLKNIMILSASSLIIKSMGMFFAVKIACVMSGEMLGRYRLVMSIYAFFLLMCTSGISVTITRLTGEMSAKEEYGKVSYIRDRIQLYGLLSGTIIGVLMILSSFILPGEFFSGGAAASVRILGASLPFAGFSAAVRGYFTAKRKIIRSAGEQILEQSAEILIFFASIKYLSSIGISPIFCAAVGTALAEFLSSLYCVIIWLYDKKHTALSERAENIIKAALPIYIPCTASAGIRSALSALENNLIPTGLMLSGAMREEALTQYGIISGMAIPCVLFPSVFIVPFSQLIVTELAQERTLTHKKNIRRIALRSLRVTIIYSLVMMLPFLSTPGIITKLLGFSSDADFYLRVLAPLIPLSYLDSAVDGMLKGLDCQKSYFHINIIESVLRVIMALTLIPLLGIKGVIAIFIFGELINVTLSLWKLLNVIKL